MIRDQKFNNTHRFCWNEKCKYLIRLDETCCTHCGWTALGKVSSMELAPVITTMAVGKMPEKNALGMNKTEARYAQYLEEQKAARVIQYYAFEPWKVRIADDCYYIPDFLVLDANGHLSLHDAKAWWKKSKKVGVKEDAMVKMKAVAALYPFLTMLMTWEVDGRWEQRVFPPNNTPKP